MTLMTPVGAASKARRWRTAGAAGERLGPGQMVPRASVVGMMRSVMRSAAMMMRGWRPRASVARRAGTAAGAAAAAAAAPMGAEALSMLVMVMMLPTLTAAHALLEVPRVGPRSGTAVTLRRRAAVGRGGLTSADAVLAHYFLELRDLLHELVRLLSLVVSLFTVVVVIMVVMAAVEEELHFSAHVRSCQLASTQ